MSDHHLFVECPGSNKLVMFFTATGAKPGLFNWWAVGHQLAESANVLFVNGWSNTWYQDGVKGLGDGLEETLDTIRTWCDEHGVDELYCTGQSMGGYGALLFSALLPARVMAFGAEAILGLPHSQWERKANKTIALLHRDLTDPEKYSFEGCLFAGERDPLDILCASKMAAHRSLRIITMRGVGHGPAGPLKNRDRLLPMLQAWIDGKELPPVKEAGRALETESFPQDFYDAWVFGREKQWQQSQDSACRAAAAYPMSDEAFLLKGNALMQLGRAPEAFEAFAVSFCLRNRPQPLALMGHALRQQEEPLEARAVYIKTLQRWPNHAPAYFGLGLAELKLGHREAAQDALLKACTIDPKNIHFQSWLKRLS